MRGLLLTLALLLAAPARAEAPAEGGRLIRRFALIVGANQGSAGRAALRFATSDARRFAQVLEELGGLAPRDELLLLDPGRAELLEAVARLRAQVEASRAEAGAGVVELVVYYSGHSDDEGILLGPDRFSYAELRQTLQSIPADVRIAILDSCSSGQFTRQKGGHRLPPFLIDGSTHIAGHAFLTSSSAAEAAQESDRLGASFFTHALISGLRGAADLSGDGRVTLNEAYQFAFDETLRRTESTQIGPQHPAYDIQLNGTGDLVMTDLHTASAGLTIAKEVAGRLFVRDQGDHLVVELLKPAGRPVELSLEPGPYQVVLEREGRSYRAGLSVGEGHPAELSAAQLLPVAQELATARGPGPAAEAAQRGPERWTPVGLLLLPGISSNQLLGDNVTNTLALSLLLGRSPHLHGLGLGLAHWSQGDALGAEVHVAASYAAGAMAGLHLAGGANLSGGDQRGLLAAGGLNYTRANLTGLQVAGLANLVGGSGTGFQLALAFDEVEGNFHGLQFSSGFNLVGADMTGLQLGALFNYAGGTTSGVQLSSLANVGGEVHGAQWSLVNVASEVDGVQVGLVNLAGTVRGAQVGLVNLSRDMSGVALGPLSLAQNGLLHLDLTTCGLGPVSSGGYMLNAALKAGTPYVYSVLSVGYSPAPNLQEGYLTFGLGGHVPFDAYFVELDLSTGVAQRTILPQRHLYNRLALTVGRQFYAHFGVVAGLTLNHEVYRGQPVASEGESNSGAQFHSGGALHLLWPGIFAGVRF